MCKKYHLRRGFAAAHPILLTQPAKSSLQLLKPLLPLLTSQMATAGLTKTAKGQRAPEWALGPRGATQRLRVPWGPPGPYAPLSA